ncbi:MAG: hypothetical protein FD549_000302 [Pelagibacterales bacterium]|nr:hypothetical protein [Pelagibacterales bacterium]
MIKKSMDETNQGFMKHLGGLSLNKIDDTNYEFSVEVREMHLNTGNIAHGGFLSTVADTGMGTAAHQVAGDRRCVTINLDLKFIAVAKLGEKLNGKVTILKKTKTLVFINCEISNNKDLVTSASGVWKIL